MSNQAEHSGGTPDYAFECDEWGEESFAVPIQYDETLNLDTIDDIVREEIRNGRSVKNLVLRAANALRSDEAAKMLSRALTLILEASDPKLFVLQLQTAAGLCDESGPSIAKRYHIRKQGFYQGVDRIREKLGLRKTRHMRDEEAKAKMSVRNGRNEK